MEHKCRLESPSFFNFSRFLLKNGEHTFGGSFVFIGQNLSESVWTNDQLNNALNTEPSKSLYSNWRDTWFEQRRIGIDYAMEALAVSADPNEMDLLQSIREEFDYLDNTQIPNVEDPTQWGKVDVDDGKVFSVSMNGNAKYSVIFDGHNGAIKSLYDSKGTHFVNTTNQPKDSGLGLFLYQTYNEEQFKTFYDEYMLKPAPCNLEYCKK